MVNDYSGDKPKAEVGFFLQGLLKLSVLVLIVVTSGCQQTKYQYNEGWVFGTSYHIVYNSKVDLEPRIRVLMDSFSHSLSTFDTSSVISKINRNTSFQTDSFFRTVFNRAQQISIETGGAFDMTVAPLVNAWGFGFSKQHEVDTLLIDSLLRNVGMAKVSMVNGIIQKKDVGVMLDASAIAKGYAVDVVASFLAGAGVENYMVEIGGEIVTAGVNPKGLVWQLGIDKPIDDPAVSEREMEMIIGLSGKALATSGNYRNFYIKDGKKYAHTINPKNGRPVQHNLLSASILANDCLTADAFATACMVMGLDSSLTLIESHPGLEACFIYHTDSGDQVTMTDGFKKIVRK
ncbi:FAD:protein FMN transferase [Geofilum sp. OHC36d9]|uniref:FAD:protein FMN transferase n=1 Tax=Geofilum sp. OHC36d9 TaxID=3458413 RepID=UPI004034336C